MFPPIGNVAMVTTRLLLSFHLVLMSESFNLEDLSKGKIFTGKTKGSEFGYSVALHENTAGKWLLVGAPRDYEGEDQVTLRAPHDGALYLCKIDVKGESSKVNEKEKCDKLNLDISHLDTDILYSNDFENSNFTQMSNDDFDWEINVGPTTSDNTGPEYDHTIQSRTQGHYMLIESSNPRSVGETSMMSTPVFPQINGACVRFWYYMYGVTVGSLNIYHYTNSSGSRMVWSLEGEQGGKWIEGRVTIISHESYKIIFEGVIGTDYHSDIGLDDVTIIKGRCPEDVTPINQSLGMTLARSSETGEILACAPTWSYTCHGQNHATGICYLLNDELQPTTMKMLSPCRSGSCTEGKMDLVFLIDGSDSVIQKDFDAMIHWLKSVISGLPLGRSLTRVGVVQYTSKPRIEFDLHRYFTLEEMREAINRISHMGGTTATGRAIDYVTEVMFSKDRGSRHDAKHVAVVITDGKSQDNVIRPSTKAKNKGIMIFAIGVGYAVQSELRNISSDPDDQFVYFVNSYDALNEIKSILQKRLFNLESQGEAFSTEQCQAGASAQFVHGQPVIGLPGLNDWTGGYSLYPGQRSTGSNGMIRTSFKDLLIPDTDYLLPDSEPEILPDESRHSTATKNSKTSSLSSSSVRYQHTTYVRTSYTRTKQTKVRPAPYMTSSNHGMTSLFPGMRSSKSKMTSSATHITSSKVKHRSNRQVAEVTGQFGSKNSLIKDILPAAAGLRDGDGDAIKKFLAHSYFGYSIASGSFSQLNAVEIAVGSPRLVNTGSVFIVQLNEKEDEKSTLSQPVFIEELPGTQMGSYYGHSVCLTDMNRDGLDELLVGAPLWMDKYEDMGQVVVYWSDPTANDPSSHRERFLLSGSSERNARFGFSILAAGDLNQDGFNDVIIGAPSNKHGDGAVFVYNGGPDISRLEKPSQIIRASQQHKEKLVYFGFSLSGGVDIDERGYLDVAISAPGSDKAVVLFSRPVVHVTVELLAFPSVVNISNPSCDIEEDKLPRDKPAMCSSVQICFLVTGESLPTIIYVNYELSADVGRPPSASRAYFYGSSKPNEFGALTDSITCSNATLIFKDPGRDLSSDIIISMNYSLTENMTSTENSPILNIYDENPANTTIQFEKECKTAECHSDLKLDCDVTGTRSHLGSKVIVLGSDRIINLYVNMSNVADDAYDVEVHVNYNKFMYLRKMTTLQDKKCIKIIHDEDDVPGYLGEAEEELNHTKTRRESQSYHSENYSTKNLHLVYKDQVMRQKEKCSLLLQFGINDNTAFTGGNISLTVQSSSINEDMNNKDNWCNETLQIYFSGDIIISGHPGKEEIQYGIHQKEDEEDETHISTFNDIGPRIKHLYFITNIGHTVLPKAKVQIQWPIETASKHDILYLTQVQCDPQHKCQCEELDVLVNPEHLNKTDSLAIESNRGDDLLLIKNNSTSNKEDDDASGKQEYTETQIRCNTKDGIKCETLRCNIKQLRPSDVVQISLKFRLWESTMIEAKVWKVTLTTNVELSTEQSPFFIAENKDLKTDVSTTAYSMLGHSTRDPVEPVTPRLWVIVLAVIAGIILLGLMIIALHRAGFFESKYRQKKEETLEWRDFDQYSSFYDNSRVQSQDDMEPEVQQRLTTFRRTNLPESPTL